MIKDLVYKEFRLNITPWSYLWLAAVLLLLIPSWVFFVAMAYIFMFFMLISQMDKANNDLAFALFLPVPKGAIVTARTCTIVILEMVVLLEAVPMCVARYWLYPAGNEVSMNTNLTFFGLMLVMYAIFNVIYLPGSYSRAYRMLWPLLGGSLIAVLVGGVLTTLVAGVPALAVLNDRGLGHLGYQGLVGGVGLLLYAGLTFLAYRKAVANILRVDL